jgi:hypothetical protein
MVANKVELNHISLPGRRPQIVRLRLVNFDIDGCVSCVCRHILVIIEVMDETMCDIRWRAALGFYFSVEIYERVSSVIIKAIHSSLKSQMPCLP